MVYLGAFLLGMGFLVMMLRQKHAVGPVLAEMDTWFRIYSPYSYVLVGVVIVAALASFGLMHFWPKSRTPRDPMEKYRKEHVMED